MAVAPCHGGPEMFDPEDRPRPPQQGAARSHEQRLPSRKTASRRDEQSLSEVGFWLNFCGGGSGLGAPSR